MVADLTNREILDLLADADPNEIRDVLVRFLRFNSKPQAVPPHCPECGTNLRNDHILELDGFRIDPRGEVRYRGKDLRFGPNQVLIFHTIAQNSGRRVTAQVIAERCCKTARVWPVKSLHAQIKHIRNKLELLEAPDPIDSHKGKSASLGYRWHIKKDRSVASRTALSLSGGVGAAEPQSVDSQVPLSSQGSTSSTFGE